MGRISILHSGWYASRRLHYLSATHIATPVTFGLELPLLTGSLWVGYGLVIGINYVDVVGVGWGRSWLVRTPATLTALRFHSPELRAQPATLGNAPTNIATL